MILPVPQWALANYLEGNAATLGPDAAARIFADPSSALFQTCGFTLSFDSRKPKENMHHRTSVAASAVKGFLLGVKSLGTQGDPRQQGGVVVLERLEPAGGSAAAAASASAVDTAEPAATVAPAAAAGTGGAAAGASVGDADAVGAAAAGTAAAPLAAKDVAPAASPAACSYRVAFFRKDSYNADQMEIPDMLAAAGAPAAAYCHGK